MVSACDTPSLHKPSFKRYGAEVSFDGFYQKMAQQLSRSLSRFYINTSGYYRRDFASNLKLTYFRTVILKGEGDGKKVALYVQAEEISTVDIYNHCFKDEQIIKVFASGDKEIYQNISYFKDKNTINEKHSIYGETIGSILFYVSNTDRAYTTINVDPQSNWSGYESSVLSGARFLYIDTCLTDTISNNETYCTYYINGSVFTFSYNNDSGYSYTYQYEIGDAIKMKAKAVTDVNQVQTGGNYKVRLEEYIDFVVERFSGSIKKQDFSNYEYISQQE